MITQPSKLLSLSLTALMKLIAFSTEYPKGFHQVKKQNLLLLSSEQKRKKENKEEKKKIYIF